MGVAGYLHATGVGFTKKTKTESAKGVILLPVGRNKISSDIVLAGDTIKDTVKNLRPDIGTRDMVKRGIHRLGVYGAVTLSRPGNPNRKGTDEHAEREAWLNRIWGASATIQVSFSRTIDRLANFADALAVTIREALSNQGLRFTSLMNLQSIYDTAVEQDDAMRTAGKRFRPVAGKILQRPATSHNRTAEELLPLRPENEFGSPHYKNKSKYNAGVKLNLTVEALK